MNQVIEIDKLGYRGVGIGKFQNKVVLVPLTAPGDRAEVRTIRAHRNYDEAELVRLLDPSPLRREPPCPYFGRCGGCQLQHIGIFSQRRLKENLFLETLSHHLGIDESRVRAGISRSEEFEYRSRVELHVRWNPEPHLGFTARASFDVIPVERCRLAMPPLNQTLAEIRLLLSESGARDVVRLELACDAPGNGVSVLLWSVRPLPKAVRKSLTRLSSSVRTRLRGLYWASGRGGSPQTLWEREAEPHGVNYKLPILRGTEETSLEAWPGVFRQVNPLINRMLITTAMAWVMETPPDRVLDLYAGMGNLTIPLGNLAREITAVEVQPLAVRNGQANADRNRTKNVRWIQRGAKQGVQELCSLQSRFDLVLLDPPRSGAREVLDGVLTLSPGRILYISCDPATLTRDLAYLLEKGPYAVDRTQSFDMFPQTFHLESMTLLRRINRSTSLNPQ